MSFPWIKRAMAASFLLAVTPAAAWADQVAKDPVARQVDLTGKILVPLIAVVLLAAFAARFMKQKGLFTLHRGLGLLIGAGALGHALYAMVQMGWEKPLINATGMLAAIGIGLLLFTGTRNPSSGVHRMATALLIAGFVAHKVMIA
ncbi:hypothetical protein GTO89_06240 [Heliobacterium gestii]|uniref:Uncharacterized protein n=1 Tax=Heliomicrobium gestii TaxID=2699 RepID=A0A845LIF8_HELGE|nr:hypothetical protein [Heliomicrobium gestii]MBM7866032.1 DMSO/TMAO reductase YedYZ heme-binding membrane subunit [Heliomicrobium gestii]MZP42636.1 hypothetical protein [Heliomicrobium gestii]